MSADTRSGRDLTGMRYAETRGGSGTIFSVMVIAEDAPITDHDMETAKIYAWACCERLRADQESGRDANPHPAAADTRPDTP